MLLPFALSNGLAAQQPLSLEDAVHASLTRNASLRAARAGSEEAAARASEARAGFFPRLSVAESWQRGDQPVFVCDVAKAAKLIGWRPTIGVREGVDELIAWTRDNRQLFDILAKREAITAG